MDSYLQLALAKNTLYGMKMYFIQLVTQKTNNCNDYLYPSFSILLFSTIFYICTSSRSILLLYEDMPYFFLSHKDEWRMALLDGDTWTRGSGCACAEGKIRYTIYLVDATEDQNIGAQRDHVLSTLHSLPLLSLARARHILSLHSRPFLSSIQSS